MSSFVENSAWFAKFEFALFDYAEWIAQLPMPMPVYDITRILNSSTVYSMAMHARHWCEDTLNHVNIPDDMANHMRFLWINEPQQQQYFARALYSHCARYVTGMPRIRKPPTDHMGQTDVVPCAQFESLAAAVSAHSDGSRHTLLCWLTNVLVYGSSRPTVTTMKIKQTQHTGRRRHRRASHEPLDTDAVQSVANKALDAISDHDRLLPRMRCVVTQTGHGKASIALYAHQRAPSDE